MKNRCVLYFFSRQPFHDFNAKKTKLQALVNRELEVYKYTENTPFSHKYAKTEDVFCPKNSVSDRLPQSEKVVESHFLDERKTSLQHTVDAIMMLTFFDAVVIAIATCSYRDSNMMLST